MLSEDDREIGHFLSGRYSTLLRGTQERLIQRVMDAEANLEQYREAARELLGDTPSVQKGTHSVPFVSR
jgi:hypothetical protein